MPEFKDTPESTDPMFDSRPVALATRFGLKAIERIRTGRDPYEFARLAASWAFMAEPSLRTEPTSGSALGEAIFRFGVAMNRAIAERVH